MLLVERPSSRLEPLLARLLSREESTEERTLSLLSGALTETLEAFFLLPRRALLRTLLRPRVDGAGETSLASPSMGGGSDGWWAVIQWSMVARELKKTREATREGQERYKRCIGMVMKVDASGKPMRERLSSTQANDAANGSDLAAISWYGARQQGSESRKEDRELDPEHGVAAFDE